MHYPDMPLHVGPSREPLVAELANMRFDFPMSLFVVGERRSVGEFLPTAVTDERGLFSMDSDMPQQRAAQGECFRTELALVYPNVLVCGSHVDIQRGAVSKPLSTDGAGTYVCRSFAVHNSTVHGIHRIMLTFRLDQVGVRILRITNYW